MSTITLNIEDSQFDQLQSIATEMGYSTVEELLLNVAIGLKESKRNQFDQALSYVLSKNKELYKRLA